MTSLAKETIIPAIGVAGLLALGYKAYQQWHHSWNLHPKPTTKHLIAEIENRFLQGLASRLTATEQQISKLKNNIAKFAPRKELENTKDLHDVLILLRDIGYLNPGHYKAHACNVLGSAGIKCDDHMEQSLELLQKVVADVLEEDAEIQEHEKDFQYDVLIAFAPKDREKAVNFCQSMVTSLQVPKLKIALLDQIENERILKKTLENIFKSSIYVFIIASENFTDDEMVKCLGDCSILQDHDARWRLVPLWMKKDTRKYEKCPLDISVMKGINYWRHAETPTNQEEKHACLKTICKTILHGRETLKFECDE